MKAGSNMPTTTQKAGEPRLLVLRASTCWGGGEHEGSDATQPELNAGDATCHLCDLTQ